MRADLRRIHSPDAYDLKTFAPDDPDCFGLLLQLMIGGKGEEGEDTFDIVVCTPAWLAKRVADSGPLLLRHYLLVEGYDWKRIHGFIVSFLNGVEGDSWDDLAERIGRFAHWEFEDYRKYGS